MLVIILAKELSYEVTHISKSLGICMRVTLGKTTKIYLSPNQIWKR